MRVVVDTNVFVSGLLSPFGPPGIIVKLIGDGQIRICYDTRILTEYLDVLRRPAFPFGEAEVAAVLSPVVIEGELIAAPPLTTRLPDPDDEPFLEVAKAACADYLVTGNIRHFPPDHRQGVRVTSPREFLETGLRNG